MLFLFAILVIAAYVFFQVMNNAERKQILLRALAMGLQVKGEAERRLAEPDPFRDALRERTSRPIVTYAIVGLNAAVFLLMLIGPGSFSNPDTLISWGASFAPRTTNGEWWRLVGSTFVHAGFFQVLVNMAALAAAGVILERLIGHVAFAVVYFAAGCFASLVNLSTYPMAIEFGASGAIYGVYGLLVAALIWGFVHRSAFTIPLRAAKVLGPAAAVFLLYSLSSDSLHGEGELVGLIAGFGCGLVLTKGASEQKPDMRVVAIPTIAALMSAVAFAIPLRGVADARPEIQRIIATEDRTSVSYRTEVDKFTRGWISAEQLAQVIERSIVPELHSTRAHLKALAGVPQEQKAMVANADEFLRLRDESWRLRADALHKSDARKLRQADKTERASLDAFEKIQAGLQK
jgi:rhomboid protease GluP